VRTRLFWDIETLPVILTGWGLWDQHFSHEHILQDSAICCASWRWDNEPRTYSVSLLDDPKRFHANPYDDTVVIKALHEVVSKAPVAIAHNGDKFDIRVLRTRCIRHKLPPFTIQTFDTLKCVKKEFKFTSNKLDNLGHDLGKGRKIDTGGIELWKRIIGPPYGKRDMADSEAAMRKMVRYNRRDVELLQQVYNDLAPWASSHPNISFIQGQTGLCCSKCQSKDVVKDGLRHTKAGVYQKWRCRSCGNPFLSERNAIKGFKPDLKAA